MEDAKTPVETLGHDLGQMFAQGFNVVILSLQSCDACAIRKPAGYDQRIFSFVSLPQIPNP